MNRVADLLAVLVAIAFGDAPAATRRTRAGISRPRIRPSNYHTENLERFAADVDRATGGRLRITVHSNATIYKAPEIKRAVQNGR